jgi:hypothetical protein
MSACNAWGGRQWVVGLVLVVWCVTTGQCLGGQRWDRCRSMVRGAQHGVRWAVEGSLAVLWPTGRSTERGLVLIEQCWRVSSVTRFE